MEVSPYFKHSIFQTLCRVDLCLHTFLSMTPSHSGNKKGLILEKLHIPPLTMFLLPFRALKLQWCCGLWRDRKLLNYSNIFSYVPKMNMGFTGLESYEGESLMTELQFLSELTL